MPSITTRHGGRRRPPHQQAQGQGQGLGQGHATAPMQQQASLSRLESNNLIDSSNMNVNGAALLTGLGELHESLMQSCGSMSVICTGMWSFVSRSYSHVMPCQSFAWSCGPQVVTCTVVWWPVSHLWSRLVSYQSPVQLSVVLSVTCTDMWCPISHTHRHVRPYQSFAHSCPLSSTLFCF